MIQNLLPYIAEHVQSVLDAMRAKGHPMKVTSTYRSFAEQNKLYAQGRTAPGNKVTNSKGGQSWHNYRCAADLCFEGNDPWASKNHKLWDIYGEVAKSFGFEWGGDWTSFQDRPHIQMVFGQDITKMQKLGEEKAILLLTSLCPMAEKKQEVPQWMQDAVAFVKEKGLSNGDRPLDPATRGEMFAMIQKLYSLLTK